MAATYPCGQPGSSSLCVSLEAFAKPTSRTFSRPFPPACANQSPWVFAHTQVRDPCESAAACFGHALGTPSTWLPKDWTLADKVLKKTPLDLQKRFPIYHPCPKYLAAHRCGSAFSQDGLASSQDREKSGKNTVGW